MKSGFRVVLSSVCVVSYELFGGRTIAGSRARWHRPSACVIKLFAHDNCLAIFYLLDNLLSFYLAPKPFLTEEELSRCRVIRSLEQPLLFLCLV